MDHSCIESLDSNLYIEITAKFRNQKLLILEKDHICEHKIKMMLAIGYIFKPLNFLLYNGFDLDGNLEFN